MPYKNIEDERARNRRNYYRDKASFLARTRRTKLRLLEYARNLKEETPCTDCGVSYPHYIMEFDHARGTKTMGVAQLCMQGSMKALLAEIEKCDIVCANCHSVRTFTRRFI